MMQITALPHLVHLALEGCHCQLKDVDLHQVSTSITELNIDDGSGINAALLVALPELRSLAFWSMEDDDAVEAINVAFSSLRQH